jgi:hypothetical protein
MNRERTGDVPRAVLIRVERTATMARGAALFYPLRWERGDPHSWGRAEGRVRAGA